jgi:hypothetical protein
LYATDQQFREYFTGAGGQAEEAESRWREFFRYYTVRPGANFSMGSHDEWNIWRELNARRIFGPTDEGFGIGSQIAGYFEGIQIVPGAAERPITPGYAIDGDGDPSPAPTLLAQTAPLTSAVKRLAGE